MITPSPSEPGAAPYVGSRPFERTAADRRRFFGRAREIDELTALVVSHNLVLVYSASGAGKSSLLDAGVAPALADEGFDVLPRGRVGLLPPTEVLLDPTANPYVLNLLCSLSPECEAVDLARCTLADRLRARPPRPGTTGRVLVIDQAEELFTFTPRDWARHQRDFVIELREALRDDPDLRIVIAGREDHLARFDDLAPLLPGAMRVRFHLDPLGREAARAAVEGPLAGTGRRFEPGVAEQLVTDLSRTKIAARGLSREEPGPSVEPVQLQLVCSALWQSLQPGTAVITAADVKAFGGVEETLERFYEETVNQCAAAARIERDRIARWFGEELITAGDTRGQVFRGVHTSEGLPNEVVALLEARHLVRADDRASGRWFELAHDRLIRPIRAVNERWAAERRAAHVIREVRRVRWRWAAGVFVTAMLLAAIVAAVAIPRLQARAREWGLTVGRIVDLSGDCLVRTPECEQQTVRVFDFVADYYWREHEVAKLVTILQAAAPMIPADYGMPLAEAAARPAGGADQPGALRIEYNPARPLDERRMRAEWAQMAHRFGERWGIDVSSAIALVPDPRIALRTVRISATPARCVPDGDDDRPRLVREIAMPASDGEALISRPGIDRDPRLSAFFATFAAQERWRPYPDLELDGPWWFVPAWTLPVWRVGGHPAVSREAVLAVMIANALQRDPALVIGCDVVRAILARARPSAVHTAAEARATRGYEGLRLDFIELVGTHRRSLADPVLLLDALAQYPPTVPAAEAARLASAATAAIDERSPAPSLWRSTGPAPPASGGRGHDCRTRPIAIAVGPAQRAAFLEPDGAVRGELAARLWELRGALYRRYGMLMPEVRFVPALEDGVAITVLARTERLQLGGGDDADGGGDDDAGDRAIAALLGALEARYRERRASWVTAEAIDRALARLAPAERDWIRARRNLTELKLLARAVVASGDGDPEEGDTLWELPWLLRSLVFWLQTADAAPDHLAALAADLRATQRGRQQPTDLAPPPPASGAARLVRAGLNALDAGRVDAAAAHFARAIAEDADAAAIEMIAGYARLSTLGPTRRIATLAAACDLAAAHGPALDGHVAIAYELVQLLDDPPEALTAADQRRFELCLAGYFADREPHLDETRRRLTALIERERPEVWTAGEALQLGQRWLRVHHREPAPPPALARARALLVRGLAALDPAAADAAWADLRDRLGPAPWGWARDAVADTARDLAADAPALALDLAAWLNRFGAVEARRALAVVDALPAAAAQDAAGDGARWRRAQVRAELAAHLAQLDEPALLRPRLAVEVAELERLARAAPADHAAAAHLALARAYVWLGRGDDARRALAAARRAGSAGVEADVAQLWLELDAGALDAASRIAADLVARAPDDLDAMFADGALATLVRRPDFEADARAFIFHDPREPSTRADDMLLLLYAALVEAGAAPEAELLLGERLRAIRPDTWPARIAQRDTRAWREMLIAYVAGRLPEAQIFDPLRGAEALAAAGLDRLERSLDGMRCEASFYAALRERATGDPATREARVQARLADAVATRQYGTLEYRIAKLVLARAGGVR